MRLRDLDTKKTGAGLFGELEENGKIKWSEKLTNQEVLECIREKRTLIDNILHRKANSIGNILREIAFFMMPLKDR